MHALAPFTTADLQNLCDGAAGRCDADILDAYASLIRAFDDLVARILKADDEGLTANAAYLRVELGDVRGVLRSLTPLVMRVVARRAALASR